MTSEILNKISTVSKHLCFSKTRGHEHQRLMVVPYEQLIVKNEKYPDKIFLIHKCLNFSSKSLDDSSYHVYSFDMNGENRNEEKMGSVFFRDMVVLKIIK